MEAGFLKNRNEKQNLYPIKSSELDKNINNLLTQLIENILINDRFKANIKYIVTRRALVSTSMFSIKIILLSRKQFIT